MQKKTEVFYSLRDGLQEPPAVLIVAIDRLPLVATGGHMVDSVFVLNSNGPRLC